MEAGARELSFASACAILEDRGWKRHEIRERLSPRYVNRVIGHPRDKEGNLRLPEAPPATREGRDAALRRRLRLNGCPEHMVEARLAELRKFSWRRRA